MRLAAGSLVPADGVLLHAQDLFVQQSAVTGESFPVEKMAGQPAGGEEGAGVLFMGSSVISGTATFLACRTGTGTRADTVGAGSYSAAFATSAPRTKPPNAASP